MLRRSNSPPDDGTTVLVAPDVVGAGVAGHGREISVIIIFTANCERFCILEDIEVVYED